MSAVLAQLPTPEAVTGWEQVGIVGILVAAIMLLLYLFYLVFFSGRVMPRQVHEEIVDVEREMRKGAEEDSRQATRDLVRLTDKYEQLLREAIYTNPIYRGGPGDRPGSQYGDRR